MGREADRISGRLLGCVRSDHSKGGPDRAPSWQSITTSTLDILNFSDRRRLSSSKLSDGTFGHISILTVASRPSTRTMCTPLKNNQDRKPRERPSRPHAHPYPRSSHFSRAQVILLISFYRARRRRNLKLKNSSPISGLTIESQLIWVRWRFMTSATSPK